MKTVGAFDAKTHLNALIKRVSRGETIRISLRGVRVALLVPANDGDRRSAPEMVRDIRELPKGASWGNNSIRGLIDEGRRY